MANADKSVVVQTGLPQLIEDIKPDVFRGRLRAVAALKFFDTGGVQIPFRDVRRRLCVIISGTEDETSVPGQLTAHGWLLSRGQKAAVRIGSFSNPFPAEFCEVPNHFKEELGEGRIVAIEEIPNWLT